MEYRAAERRLAQNKAELDMWTNGPRKEEIAKARHDVAAQRAVSQRLERDVQKTTIRAPFDGLIVSKRTEIGEWLEEGGPVCEMIAIATVKVRADAPESTIPFARPGAPASVEIEALARSQAASVSRVIPVATPAARTFPIEVDLPNPDHALLPGMFVWVHIPSGPPGKRLMVSKDAIVASGPNKQIFVVRDAPPGGPPGGGPPGADAKSGDGPPGKLAVPLPVVTGLELGTEIEVQSPALQAGDLVVVRANERLFGPTPIQPTPAADGSASSQPVGQRQSVSKGS
jgi:multidrug efflux pump subunit AcrA (membrane-fusion protein)